MQVVISDTLKSKCLGLVDKFDNTDKLKINSQVLKTFGFN